MAKRKIDATPFQWQPFSSKQKKLLTWWTPQSPYKNFDIMIAGGSIRSGKTVSMIDSFLTWSQSTYDTPKNFIIAGKTMGALKRNVLEPLFRILSAKGWAYEYVRSGDPYIKVGLHTYYLFGASNAGSQDTLQGLTASGAYLDEVALLDEGFVKQSLGRLSDDDGGRNPAKSFWNCNPDTPFHYIKQEYIDNWKKKRVFYLHFTLDDNLSLSKAVKDRYYRMYTGVWFKRMILGLWVVADGIVYDDYADRHKINRKKIQQMIKDREFVEFIGGADFGYSHPMVGHVIGIDRTGRYWLIDEFYKKRKKTSDLSKWFLDQQKRLYKQIRVIFCDAAEPDRIVEMREAGLPARKAIKDIGTGINAVGTQFKNDSLFINTEDCKMTDMELQTYRYPDTDDPKARKDLPLDEYNHAMDALRYAIFNWMRYILGLERRDRRKEERSGRVVSERERDPEVEPEPAKKERRPKRSRVIR